jgi:ABC-type branched-subunit amino acid transport system substrate-binding protein
VALAVVERQAIAGKALAAGNGQASGGIESTGEENDSRLHHGAAIYLKSARLSPGIRLFLRYNSRFRPAPEISMSLRLTALAAALLLAGSVHAADKIKVGFVSTLSGPGAGLGVDIRDGFNLAMKSLNGKLGGLPAEVLIADDQQSPDTAKQAADKFLKKDKVDFMTGIVFSNIMLAVGPSVFENKTFYISANAGPSQYAGEQCNPFFFNVAWQNDNLHEAVGKTCRTRVSRMS